MEGPELFAITVRHLTTYSMQALKAAGLTSAELDWVVPQQANRNIVDRISQRLGFSRTKFIENVAEYGNTSAASHPHRARRGGARRPDPAGPDGAPLRARRRPRLGRGHRPDVMGLRGGPGLRYTSPPWTF